MNIAIVGNNDGPLRLVQALREAGISPVAVGLQKSVSADLQQQYSQWTEKATLFEHFAEPALLQRLRGVQVDLLVNCFCNFKFKTLLDMYPVLNVHLAPLPRYRGRHPLHWALINGERSFGATIHRMSREIDAGEILWQKMLPISSGMSVQELREALMQLLQADFGPLMLSYQLDQLTPLPNPDEQATYVARRFPEDSVLNEWHDRDKIYRKVMALRSENNPACLLLNEQTIPVRRAATGNRRYVGFARPFVSQVFADGVEVVCTDGLTVRLLGFDARQCALRMNQTLA